MKIYVPPIKSQGIKTKLVPWIKSIVPQDFSGTWIEPFMGTGVVAFNIMPKRALLTDTNPHLINFYTAIAEGVITPVIVRQFLMIEGEKLQTKGQSYYYEVRDRFNKKYHPLDFLFLNRAGFNGMIRFNRKGELNIPFCHKPQRFSQSYITKIVNQVEYVSHLLATHKFVFKCQSFKETIKAGTAKDIIYCDPPYIGRHVGYYNGWNDTQERELFQCLNDTSSRFILSTWHHNIYRQNQYISSLWVRYNILTREHFYHVGAKEKNRNAMIEALITNYAVSSGLYEATDKQQQLTLFEA